MPVYPNHRIVGSKDPGMYIGYDSPKLGDGSKSDALLIDPAGHVSAVLVQVLATVMASARFMALARFFNYTAAALPLG